MTNLSSSPDAPSVAAHGACPHFHPPYPEPLQSKAGAFKRFLLGRGSWLHTIYARSYSMQMGEVKLPGRYHYMVNEPGLVQQVLVERAADFPKSVLLGEALEPLLGESIFTTNGAQWQRQRAMMDPAFEQARLKVAFPLMAAAARDMLARLARLAPGEEYDLEVEMTHVTADIIFRTIFSVAMEGSDAHKVFSAFARYQAYAPRLMLPAVYGVRWLVWPWDRWQSRRASREIRELLVGLIRPRYEAWQVWLKAHPGEAPPPPADILDSFMQARDAASGEPFGFDELVNQVAMLFLAGHETSASALTWASYLLAQCPEIQERVHAEVVSELGGPQGVRDIEQGDIKSLRLTRDVFRETLRLYPPVGFFVREAARGCPMRDKQVKAGSTVMIAPWLIQRHRKYWADPDAFDPDRYERDEAASRESLKKAYLPFSMGPRVCLGAAFAQQEAVLILAQLMRHYRLEAVPGHVPEPAGRLTIRSDNGVRLRVHRRGGVAVAAAASA